MDNACKKNIQKGERKITLEKKKRKKIVHRFGTVDECIYFEKLAARNCFRGYTERDFQNSRSTNVIK